jgi:DNA-binding NtrC family response regulator
VCSFDRERDASAATDAEGDQAALEAVPALAPSKAKLDQARGEAERQYIAKALAQNNGRVGKTARSLGISRVTLWMKMKRLQLPHDATSTNGKKDC